MWGEKKMKKIVVKEEYLPVIENEKRFLNAIQLGRIVGAIRYNKAIYAIISQNKEVSTSQLLYLVLNHAALLYEAITKFCSTKSDFENLEIYKRISDAIEKILAEAKEPNSFTNKVLKKIRNKVAFHFDEDVIKIILTKIIEGSLKEKKEVVLIAGISELVKDTTYLLADNVNINYVLGLIQGEKKSEKEKFIILSENLLNLSGSFCDVLDQLIPDLIMEYCELKEEEEN